MIHCTDHAYWKPDDAVRHYLREDMKWPSLPYHIFIDREGKCYQTLLLDACTYHAAPWNHSSLAIGVAYHGYGAPNPPARTIIKGMQDAAAFMALIFNLSPTQIKLHRELRWNKLFRSRADNPFEGCPGYLIDPEKLRKSVGAKMQLVLRDILFYSGKIDGIWGIKSAASLYNLHRKPLSPALRSIMRLAYNGI